MRITCPNCGAQYEVDDGLIPATGRDVQCSNCGHAWFQVPPGCVGLADGSAAGLADELAAGLADGPGDDAVPDAPAPPLASRPPLDDDLRAILREEAVREAAARAAEAGARAQPARVAPPPGPAAPAATAAVPAAAARVAAVPAAAARVAAEAGARAQPARVAPPPGPAAPAAAVPAAAAARVAAEAGARLRPPEASPKPPAHAATPARAAPRDRLPDIEAINSTLGGYPRAGMAPPPRRGGFARGFAAVLVLAVLVALTYLAAPLIAAAIPALAGPLAAFTDAIDALHRMLADALRGGG